jgi:hypothetical protein
MAGPDLEKKPKEEEEEEAAAASPWSGPGNEAGSLGATAPCTQDSQVLAFWATQSAGVPGDPQGPDLCSWRLSMWLETITSVEGLGLGWIPDRGFLRARVQSGWERGVHGDGKNHVPGEGSRGLIWCHLAQGFSSSGGRDLDSKLGSALSRAQAFAGRRGLTIGCPRFHPRWESTPLCWSGLGLGASEGSLCTGHVTLL